MHVVDCGIGFGITVLELPFSMRAFRGCYPYILNQQRVIILTIKMPLWSKLLLFVDFNYYAGI